MPINFYSQTPTPVSINFIVKERLLNNITVENKRMLATMIEWQVNLFNGRYFGVSGGTIKGIISLKSRFYFCEIPQPVSYQSLQHIRLLLLCIFLHAPD